MNKTIHVRILSVGVRVENVLEIGSTIVRFVVCGGVHVHKRSHTRKG